MPIALIWIGYNLARWGTWYDIGYTTWYHQDQAGMPTGSPFRLQYLPYQLWSFFVQTPERIANFPWLQSDDQRCRVDLDVARARARVLRAQAAELGRSRCGLRRCLCAAPNFLYYVNGFAQFGMRHALDFEPFLVALMFLGMQRAPARVGQGAHRLLVRRRIVGRLVLELVYSHHINSASCVRPLGGRRCSGVCRWAVTGCGGSTALVSGK